jgi:uncharacterized protein (TIGR02646 family)
MMPFVRGPEPEALVERGEKWTERYRARLEAHAAEKQAYRHNPEIEGPPKKTRFRWPQYKKQPLNQYLGPRLSAMTAGHCSYCDGFPLGVMSTKTIDHFEPKERFPEHAFTWSNLYACCNACQDTKGTAYEDSLIAPDEVDYTFSTYFLFNYNTGEIEINGLASPDKQRRAKSTLGILGLNERDSELALERLRVHEDAEKNPDRPIKLSS